jgi:Zn finger protein HypA/HybF involved in hydrogenase expression
MNEIIRLPSGIHFKRTTFSNYSKEELINTINECDNISHILQTLKLNSTYHYKIKKFIENHNISTNHFKIRYRNTNNSQNKHCSNTKLKIKLIQKGNLKKECDICKLGSTWNDKPLTLQLDHINGDHYDNSFDNLRLLCPNCHSQTDTFTGRNMKNSKIKNNCEKKLYDKQDIIKDKEKVKIEDTSCKKCNKQITKRSKSKLCLICVRYQSRNVERPPYESLINDVNTIGVLPTSRKYNVSNTTIIKWIKNYEKHGI